MNSEQHLKVWRINYLRANLFKNQADLYWMVIYDPSDLPGIFFGGRPVDRYKNPTFSGP